MDVNNTPYFLLRSEDELAEGSSRLHYDHVLQALTLAQNQNLRLPASDPAAALGIWETTKPMAVDRYYQVARLSSDGLRVEFNSGRGWLPLQDGELQTVSAPVGSLRDLNLNREGRLAIPFSNGADQHGLLLFDLRKRWLNRCSLPAQPRRAWLDALNKTWIIGADLLMLCQGEPLPLSYEAQDDRFEPLNENPEAPELRWQQALPGGWQALAICGDENYLYILVHDNNEKQRILRRPLSIENDRAFIPFELAGDIPFGVDLAVAAAGRLAVLAPQEAGDTEFRQRDCPVVNLHLEKEADIGQARLIHERYPMLSLAQSRFASSADGQLRYQAELDPDYPDFNPRPRELHALSHPRYHLEASAVLQEVLDSGAPKTTWHRLYLNACIPPGCSIHISARVYDTPDQRGGAELIAQPDPVWNPLPSELPFQHPLAGHRPDQRGLFEILLQRRDGPVRRLTGRYLQLQVHFTGNGRTTPSLHAIRVYQPRFSYQEAYLPEMYRQELSYNPEHNSEPANGADTRERLLASFEGMLSPIEARIAASEQLVHPDSAPTETLEWLAQSLGVELPGHWPEERQRRWLKYASLMQQYKGTNYGLNLALDIITDGGVQRGGVVVVENFRLRRTMATTLGRDMDDSDHPLTLGTGVSGNSIVGESLILSDMNSREFLALFAPELADEEETEAVEAFFKLYAHRLSILLHGEERKQKKPIEKILREYVPANLQWSIIETEKPFILGASPLLKVDTYLERRPEPEPVILGETLIGRDGFLHNPAAFSPRDINKST